MERYDERKDLAPRDIVARAIDSEMKRAGTEHVYLDCRHMDKAKLIEHFPISMKNAALSASIPQSS
jgi:L-aspartate oxidase